MFVAKIKDEDAVPFDVRRGDSAQFMRHHEFVAHLGTIPADKVRNVVL